MKASRDRSYQSSSAHLASIDRRAGRPRSQRSSIVAAPPWSSCASLVVVDVAAAAALATPVALALERRAAGAHSSRGESERTTPTRRQNVTTRGHGRGRQWGGPRRPLALHHDAAAQDLEGRPGAPTGRCGPTDGLARLDALQALVPLGLWREARTKDARQALTGEPTPPPTMPPPAVCRCHYCPRITCRSGPPRPLLPSTTRHPPPATRHPPPPHHHRTPPQAHTTVGGLRAEAQELRLADDFRFTSCFSDILGVRNMQIDGPGKGTPGIASFGNFELYRETGPVHFRQEVPRHTLRIALQDVETGTAGDQSTLHETGRYTLDDYTNDGYTPAGGYTPGGGSVAGTAFAEDEVEAAAAVAAAGGAGVAGGGAKGGRGTKGAAATPEKERYISGGYVSPAKRPKPPRVEIKAATAEAATAEDKSVGDAEKGTPDKSAGGEGGGEEGGEEDGGERYYHKPEPLEVKEDPLTDSLLYTVTQTPGPGEDGELYLSPSSPEHKGGSPGRSSPGRSHARGWRPDSPPKRVPDLVLLMVLRMDQTATAPDGTGIKLLEPPSNLQFDADTTFGFAMGKVLDTVGLAFLDAHKIEGVAVRCYNSLKDEWIVLRSHLEWYVPECGRAPFAPTWHGMA